MTKWGKYGDAAGGYGDVWAGGYGGMVGRPGYGAAAGGAGLMA